MRCSSKIFALSALALFVLSGCDSKPTPKPTSSTGDTTDLLAPLSERLAAQAEREAQEKAANGTEDDSSEPSPDEGLLSESGKKPWITAEELPWNANFLQFVDGRRIGYTELKVLPPAMSSSRRINVIRNDSVEFTRAGSAIRVQVAMDGLEINDGRLDSFTETTINGEREIITTGKLSRGVLSLNTTMGDTTKNEKIDVEIGVWGLMGMQAVLMSEPMKPGQKRKAKYYVHSLRKVVDAEFTALEPEMTAMLDGSKLELIPIDVVQMASEENGLRSRNWVNERGELYKTVSFSGLNISWFRTTTDVLNSIRDGYRIRGGEFELTMPIKGDTSGIDASTRRIVFSVDGLRDDPFQAFASEGHQQMKSVTARSSTLTTVSATPEELPSPSAPEDIQQYLASSKTIDSESRALKTIADGWISGDSATEKAASLVQSFASEFEELPELQPEVRTSYQLTTSKKADVLEAARLCTAMLRTQEIPTRIAAGAVLDVDSQTLQFHAWIEAWVDDKWVGLDPTSGKQIGARHIKFGDSAMATANPFELLFDVIEQFENYDFSISSVTGSAAE